jgi:ribosomal protein S2
VEWASTHTFSLVSGLNDTSRAQLQRLVGVYFEQQLTLAELRKRLTGVFGPVRAEAIAVTEVTRASVNGELAAVAEIEAAGIKMTAIWNTNADERVCPICVPRNGKARGDGWQDYPPVHVRDRCWISHAISTS